MSSSKNPLKAAYSKVREAEERHAEKLRAKAARTAAPAERAPAYTKTLQATKDKAAARRKALAQTERASVAAAVRVRKDDGGTLPMGKALYLVQSFLQGRERHAEASVEQIREAVGINIDPGANPQLHDALTESEHVEVVPAAGVLRLRYRPKHGVRDAAMLAALLSRAVVSGVPRSELVATKEQPQACYEGVEADIEKLIREGRRTETLDASQMLARAVAIERPDTRDRVLFAPTAAKQAPAGLRAAWAAVEVPRGDDLQAALVQRKLLSKEELEVRRARKAAAIKAREEAKRAAKPKRERVGSRKITNTHLDLGK
ncbi:hypothetical protein EMIHUDRAFT_435429 [Emiliania huxleyi CCMP1516]|uniref:TFIIE beta domain-containing protein n=2 Tax=Emiliania huxleyi TaxID=2903 RepID=A0A0D3JMC6_EMIH1|nr:hypothetical protein EMIHUDRAFT_435429 [Emiliania huxleyi CCMP1516]EOD24661.1 hypothetical protein EMIHUDRAFT_435429 [Emiliania huxleyi CCMP1516]|eukprot:XP_005777090.1 hypothetical protein EMIHUDRAFT_435429 [Emiliania huxleyi CCMP1516]